MNTLHLQDRKFDLERAMITIGVTLMEVTGIVLLFCGLFDIRLF